MRITKDNVYDVIERIIKDPSASNWLKESIRVSMSRDIVDAANDAELLASILSAKAKNVFSREVL